jgi:hypothetical protein
VHEFSQYTRIIAGSIAMLALVSCKRRESSDSASGRMESPAAAATPSDTAPAPVKAPGGLTDPNIVALLDEANAADSASGAYADR